MIKNTTRKLPSGLLIRKTVFDDGSIQYSLVSVGRDEWHPGISYIISEEEYNALYPLSREAMEI